MAELFDKSGKHVGSSKLSPPRTFEELSDAEGSEIAGEIATILGKRHLSPRACIQMVEVLGQALRHGLGLQQIANREKPRETYVQDALLFMSELGSQIEATTRTHMRVRLRFEGLLPLEQCAKLHETFDLQKSGPTFCAVTVRSGDPTEPRGSVATKP